MYCFRFLYYRARRAVVSRTHRWLWPHIHTWDDGRGRRVALVDGVEVPRAFYANTRAGFVRYHLEPVRAYRRRTAARWAKRRGVVVVLPREETVEMTFDKMLRVLEQLKGEHGQVGISTGSELTIEPVGQLSKTNHVWLLKRGFVYVDRLYIYRPRS